MLRSPYSSLLSTCWGITPSARFFNFACFWLVHQFFLLSILLTKFPSTCFPSFQDNLMDFFGMKAFHFQKNTLLMFVQFLNSINCIPFLRNNLFNYFNARCMHSNFTQNQKSFVQLPRALALKGSNIIDCLSLANEIMKLVVHHNRILCPANRISTSCLFTFDVLLQIDISRINLI